MTTDPVTWESVFKKFEASAAERKESKHDHVDRTIDDTVKKQTKKD
jgi:hypothetical protein